jgi:hypothetical protein
MLMYWTGSAQAIKRAAPDAKTAYIIDLLWSLVNTSPRIGTRVPNRGRRPRLAGLLGMLYNPGHDQEVGDATTGDDATSPAGGMHN